MDSLNGLLSNFDDLCAVTQKVPEFTQDEVNNILEEHRYFMEHSLISPVKTPSSYGPYFFYL